MLRRLPLMAKMLFVTVLAASAVFAGLDRFQARRLKTTLYGQLEVRLQQQASEDRYRFHLYVNAHRQAVRLLASQKNLATYIEQSRPFGGDPEQIAFHSEIPPWLPKPSVLRAFISIQYALLLDPEGRVREVFQGTPEPPPGSLLRPSELLRTLTHNQSIMTKLDGRPFLVTSETAAADGAPRAALLLASPLDEDFLVRSQGAVGEPRLVALLEGDPPTIAVSSNRDALPPGDPVTAVEGKYLLTGKSFFDLASSDLVMMFASFIPTADVDATMDSILAEGRKGRAIIAAALIFVAAMIVLWITLHTRRLSRSIEEFSRGVLGSAAAPAAGGDEIYLIESRFRTLTAEVVEARGRLEREADEKLVLQRKALAAERQEQELKLLQALQVSEENYHAIFDSANDAIFVFDVATGNVLDANLKAEQLLGRPRDTVVGRHFAGIHPPEEEQECRALFEAAVRKASTISSDVCVLRADGRAVPVEISTSVMQRDGTSIALGIFRDISERRRVEALANARFRRLSALHSIDLIISSSLDLHVALEEFIGHVIAQLSVDAADVLLLDPFTQTLEYAAGSGFRTEGIRRSRLRLGEGIAGVAALERRSIHLPNLAAAESTFLRAPLLAGESFVSYSAVPLTAKGRVQGVLEVLHRSALVFDEEQLGFLEALASQAAIAIDNASLFDSLQRSNIDLTLAYDATLEGWAHALDLRDRVTERHTERVTDMTVRLAREMGIREEEIVHVRRGALLHDIGKIGIPDSILKKPGPLTPEEWETMRKHPRIAFEMLQPIVYLRPALDIPYCHHEHWDGSGYPRGLKGEQIPLAARIFALTDIWDAIHASDRPYRHALPSDEACEHIRSLAGTHLDPSVVEIFLRLKDDYCRPDAPAPASAPAP